VEVVVESNDTPPQGVWRGSGTVLPGGGTVQGHGGTGAPYGGTVGGHEVRNDGAQGTLLQVPAFALSAENVGESFTVLGTARFRELRNPSESETAGRYSR
jgi:hypothetical protein